MMSKRLELIVNEAIKKANDRRHEYLTLESILLAMLDDQQVNEVLGRCGANITLIRHELNQFLGDPANFSVLTDEQVQQLSQQQFVDDDLRRLAQENGILYQPEISLSLQRVIQRAAIHVQSSGKQYIRGINLLVAMFQEKESYALYVLKKQGVERFDVVKEVAHQEDRPVTEDLEDNGVLHEVAPHEVKREQRTALDEYCTNLSQQAKDGKIDPLIGRGNEITRIIQILCRRRKNNPLLVGEAGVGKTAIAEGLALAIVENKVPDVLKDTSVFSLDMAALLAGAKFRGDFEQRLKGVIRELEKKNDKEEKAILFIDEIHTVIGAGATQGSSMDASNLLKPSLSSGRIRCLGSTTHEEYRKFIEKDAAFNRRFQKIDIDEPNKEDTVKILQGLRPRFEKHHNVKYSNAILRMAVDLSDKYITDRKNPDKAIDVIDEAGASTQLLPESKRHTNITKKDIEQVVSSLARVPKASVASDEKEKLKKLNDNLKLLIFGQNEAIDRVTDAIVLSRSGLGHDRRPMASFLFAGPTGVGKTELARQLAFQLGGHLERFDMSEYMEKHTVAKLIGAPPGYVGHEGGGLLTDAIKKYPHCVLLLDEIEKAHPDIFNILLQVMDNGCLTDSHGRVTDFRNVVIIMTTNAGAKDLEAGSIGLQGANGPNLAKRDKAIKNFFTPEFRNRLDGIVHFNKLSEQFILQIVDKFIIELEEKLTAKNVEIIVSDDAKKWLADSGYDPQMGARPISRLFDQKLKKPLSQAILFGELEKGGRVKVDVNQQKDGLSLHFES